MGSQGWNLAKETVPRPQFPPHEAAALGRYRFYLTRSDLNSNMIRIALLAAATLATLASAAREGKMMATTETVRMYVKTDFYCYKTDKLIIPIKKFKECESSSGYRNKRSVIIDDRIEQSEEDFIMDKFINPTKPAEIEIEKDEPVVGSSVAPSRKARFFNKYIITFTSTLYITKYTGTTSIKFKCTPQYSFIPNCDTDNLKDWIDNKKDNVKDDDDDRHRPGYNPYDRPHYGEGSYSAPEPENGFLGFGLFGR